MASMIKVEQLTRPRPEDGVASTITVTVALSDGSVWRAVAIDGVALPLVLALPPCAGGVQ